MASMATASTQACGIQSKAATDCNPAPSVNKGTFSRLNFSSTAAKKHLDNQLID